MRTEIKTADGKRVCVLDDAHIHVAATGFPAKTGDASLDRLNQASTYAGIFDAWRLTDGTFDVDCAAGAQRYSTNYGPRKVGNALRKLGFSQKQVNQILEVTRNSRRLPAFEYGHHSLQGSV
jgi:hypothetical protein